MSDAPESNADQSLPKGKPLTKSSALHSQPPLTMDALIRFTLILLLALWCFKIVSPFLILLLWGLIIAVALQPVFVKCSNWLGGRQGVTAILLAGTMIAALVVPAVSVGNSAIENMHEPLQSLKEGTFELPALPDSAATWPIIGKPLVSFWTEATNDLGAALGQFEPYLKTLVGWLGSTLSNAVASVFQSIFSIVIAAVFWVHGAVLVRGATHIAVRLFGTDGSEYIKLSGLTVQSVAQGVIGVAVIQAVLAGIGLVLVGAPFAGVWVLLVLILSVAQLPPILILGPVAAYLFSVESSAVATAFLVWSFLVSFSDAILKPMLLGRGLDIPMIVILVGAIGGMIMSGFLGLFVGAVVLGLAYQLTQKWALDK